MNVVVAQYYHSGGEKTSSDSSGVDGSEVHALVDVYKKGEVSEEDPNVQELGGPSLARVKLAQHEESLKAWVKAEKTGISLAKSKFKKIAPTYYKE